MTTDAELLAMCEQLMADSVDRAAIAADKGCLTWTAAALRQAKTIATALKQRIERDRALLDAKPVLPDEIAELRAIWEASRYQEFTHDRAQVVCDALAKALRYIAQQAAQWRPISEAPRDGTKIIYRAICPITKEPFIGECYWREGEEIDPSWWDESCTMAVDARHFMPLPQPPKETP